MIPKCVSLYGQLLEQKTIYDNQRIHKNSKNNKLNSVARKNPDESSTKEYDSDSSSDSTNCSWWRNVYGFDMRVPREFIVDSHSKNAANHNYWCIMPEPIIQFFDPCKVNTQLKNLRKHQIYIDQLF